MCSLKTPKPCYFLVHFFMFSNICYTFGKSFLLDLLRLEKVPKYLSFVVGKNIYIYIQV